MARGKLFADRLKQHALQKYKFAPKPRTYGISGFDGLARTDPERLYLITKAQGHKLALSPSHNRFQPGSEATRAMARRAAFAKHKKYGHRIKATL